MTAIERAGAGMLARSNHLNADCVRETVTRLIDVPSYRARATALALEFTRWNSGERFRRFVDSAVGGAARSPSNDCRFGKPEASI
jgi:UDP:flavonoid glycosyltransferase YjiC (YdhE family)